MHPNLMAAVLPRDKIWKQPTGKSTRTWTTACGTYIQEGGTKPSEEEERTPLAATQKDLGRSPGSQASQTEEDRYYMHHFQEEAQKSFTATH